MKPAGKPRIVRGKRPVDRRILQERRKDESVCYNPAMEPREPRAKRSRSGLSALRTRVRVRGLQAIDRRTVAARALLGWRDDLIDALGGEQAVSPQQRALVDLAVRTRLYVESVDAWIVQQPSLVHARRRSILPVVRERQALADSLARLLGRLGPEPDGIGDPPWTRTMNPEIKSLLLYQLS
jgi:hypothetical protein